MEDLNGKKRVREDLEVPLTDRDLPEVKRLRENLLDSLEADDEAVEVGATNLDLDLFMKSFEREIAASTASSDNGDDAVAAEVLDRISDSGDSQPGLGYLLEASDDDLGLPPTTSSPPADERYELGRGFWEFEEEIPSYEAFGFEVLLPGNFGGGEDVEFVAIDGLFDYSDAGFGASDFFKRPESYQPNKIGLQ